MRFKKNNHQTPIAKPNSVTLGGNSNNAPTINVTTTKAIKPIHRDNINHPTHLTRNNNRNTAATAVLGLSTPEISASTNAKIDRSK